MLLDKQYYQCHLAQVANSIRDTLARKHVHVATPGTFLRPKLLKMHIVIML